MEQITHPFVRKSVFIGVLDRNLKKIEARLGVELTIRGDSLNIGGPAEKIEFARLYFDRIRQLEEKGHDLKEEDFQIILDLLEQGRTKPVEDYFPAEPLSFARKSVSPKSLNQQEYIQSIRTHDLIFGVGPAGTGKTYLAMAMALTFLQNKIVNRIILTRPAVEAGEALGFLPGDLYEKLNPYLRPLYDALYDMLPLEEVQHHLERGVIEIAPLAYMRGRTLNQAFIILDEAQNSTSEQMLMFLTRLGNNSKAIITGDPSQVDLPANKRPGLAEAVRILRPIEGIAFIEFHKSDVVRHHLVQRIIAAYEESRPPRK